MAVTIDRVHYFYATVKDEPGEAYQLLSRLAAVEVNLLAFNAFPCGPQHTQLVLFPENIDDLVRAADEENISLIGPQKAFLVQGDDHLGALAGVHGKLADASINVYASNGVTDGRGGYGYIVYVKPEDYDQAANILDL